MDKMTDSRAADVLAAHNEWRRGGDGPQTEPVTLGLALERAVARLREPAGVGGLDLELIAEMLGNLRNGDDAYYTPSAVDAQIHALQEMSNRHEALAAPQPPAEAQGCGDFALPINDAVPAPTKIEPGNLFLWNWRAMQEYARTCIAEAQAQGCGEVDEVRLDLVPWLYVIRSEFLPDDNNLGRDSDKKMREALDWATNAMRERAALSAPAVATKITSEETERLCQESFDREDGYGDRLRFPRNYSIFRDGFHCGLTAPRASPTFRGA